MPRKRNIGRLTRKAIQEKRRLSKETEEQRAERRENARLRVARSRERRAHLRVNNRTHEQIALLLEKYQIIKMREARQAMLSNNRQLQNLCFARGKLPDGTFWQPSSANVIRSAHVVTGAKLEHPIDKKYSIPYPSSPSYIPTIFPSVDRNKSSENNVKKSLESSKISTKTKHFSFPINEANFPNLSDSNRLKESPPKRRIVPSVHSYRKSSRKCEEYLKEKTKKVTVIKKKLEIVRQKNQLMKRRVCLILYVVEELQKKISFHLKDCDYLTNI